MRTFITDDEEDSRSLIRMYLEDEFPSIKIVGEARGIEDTLTQLSKKSIDLLFLDIQLPKGTGFDILDHLKLYSFQTIFITAYDQFAINAIKHNALDYILKPIDRAELVQAVFKAFKNKGTLPDLQPSPSLRRIKLPTLNGFKVIEIDNIVRCQADGNYTRFKFKDRTETVVSKTLKTFEKLLTASGNPFVRVHQAHIVNTSCIQEYIKGRGGEIILIDGSRVNVAESRKKDLLNHLGI